MEARFFDSAAAFRDWLQGRHSKESKLLVGFYKVASGGGGLTYAGALDEALCYGWINGVRKSRDAATYTVRFTPRKPRSIWSNVNVKRVAELKELGLMQPAGVAAFDRRTPERTGIYSAEQGEVVLGDPFENTFRANDQAWAFFQAQPATYRKAATWWLTGAKRDETKHRRLDQLIAESAAGRRLRQFVSPKAPSRTT